MSPSRPEPRSGLPASYESPWRRLGADLRAVLASCSLKLRELWRRNAEGDLPWPAFWPAALAPLFWPLLLALVLAAALAAGVLLGRPAQPGPSGAPGADAGVAPQQEEAASSVADPFPTEAPPGLTTGDVSGSERRPESQAGKVPVPAVESAGEPVQAPEPAMSPSPEQQLLQELAGGAEGALLIALESDPSAALLRLQLKADYAELPEPEQRRLAASWQERALSLGYERLELRGSDGQLLARPARVGSGMILLESSAGRR